MVLVQACGGSSCAAINIIDYDLCVFDSGLHRLEVSITFAVTSTSHDISVHYNRMKNITLSADEELIEQARAIARAQRKTLNAVFREWLLQFTAQSGSAQEFDSLMKRLRHVRAGRGFSRDEMNER